jgi:hypothetical protein
VRKHNTDNDQYGDSAHIDKNLNNSQEVSVKGYINPSYGEEKQNQTKSRPEYIAEEDNSQRCAYSYRCQYPEDDIKHRDLSFCSVSGNSPSVRLPPYPYPNKRVKSV